MNKKQAPNSSIYVPVNLDINHKTHSIVAILEQRTPTDETDLFGYPVYEKQIIYSEIPVSQFNEEDIPEILYHLLRNCKKINPKYKDLLEKILHALISGSDVPCTGLITIERIREYYAAIYEDMASKIQATYAISRLCYDYENLDVISQNDYLLASLARTLRDEGLKNIEIGTNVSFIFFSLSRFERYYPKLITHKIASSLVKLLEQEEKRYATQYREILYRKKDVDMNSYASKDRYKSDYERFKQVIQASDKMIFSALQTIYNLSEITQITTGDAMYCLPIDKLIPLLISVLKRKSNNGYVIIAVVNFLHRLSVQPEAAGIINSYNLTGYLVNLIQSAQSDEFLEPILRLLYNLSFFRSTLEEMISLDIHYQLNAYVAQIKARLLRFFRYDCAKCKTELQCVTAVCDAHSQHDENDPQVQRMAKSAALCSRLVCKIGDTEQRLQRLSKTDIALNLTYIVCLCPNPPLETVLALANLSSSYVNAQYIVASGAHECMLKQFDKIRDVRFAKVFGNLAMSTRGTPTDSAAEVAYCQKFISIAADCVDDFDMVNECLIVIAGSNASSFGEQDAVMLLRLAFGVLNAPEMRLDLSIYAVGTIATLLSSRKHVSAMACAEEFHYLPELLLRYLAESLDYMNSLYEEGIFYYLFNGKQGSVDDYELAFESMEYDLLLNVMVAIMRSVVYEELRYQFVKMPQFITILKKLMGEPLDRPENDQIVPRYMQQMRFEESKEMQKMQTNTADMVRKMQERIQKQQLGTQKPLIWKSKMSGIKDKVWDLILGIADYIFEIVCMNEKKLEETWKRERFLAYNGGVDGLFVRK